MPPLPDQAAAPFMAEVTRGGIVESRHAGIAAVVDADGAVVHRWGDIDQPVFPRSAIKPLQALAFIESGAADAFSCGPAELALACASHIGMAMHTDAVAAWLDRIGVGEAALGCGTHPPSDRATANALAAAGAKATARHNNCSGKHAAMLTTAVHLGAPIAGYVQPGHPVQRRVAQVLGDLYGRDLDTAPHGIDGCSIPTSAVPLRNIAHAMARFATPDTLAPDRAAAARRLHAAITGHPALIAGPGRFDTLVMQVTGADALVKVGAEGVYCAALPGLGLGIALKILDGAPRGARVALGAVLQRVGVLPEERAARLASCLTEPLSNHMCIRIGEVRPSLT